MTDPPKRNDLAHRKSPHFLGQGPHEPSYNRSHGASQIHTHRSVAMHLAMYHNAAQALTKAGGASIEHGRSVGVICHHLVGSEPDGAGNGVQTQSALSCQPLPG